jgi:hypothetical protein
MPKAAVLYSTDIAAPTMEDHHADSRVGIWLKASCRPPNTRDIAHTGLPQVASPGAQPLCSTILGGEAGCARCGEGTARPVCSEALATEGGMFLLLSQRFPGAPTPPGSQALT